MPLALYALAVAIFAIGTTEFVVVNLIPGVAIDLSASIPNRRAPCQSLRPVISLGTPVFSAITGALPGRGLAIALFAVFTTCNLFTAVPPSHSTLLLSLIAMAIAHGILFGVCYLLGIQVKGRQRNCCDDGSY